MNQFCEDAKRALLSGGIAVIPTDTLYGIVTRAEDSRAVERVYHVRGRDEKKPCIVLIADISNLVRFGVTVSEKQNAFLESVWPGKVSVILPCADERFTYLHRGGGTIAFRVPAHEGLRAFLKETGPLIAPSANPEGKPPAQTSAEARGYFGDSVDAYYDGGILKGSASKVISFTGDVPEILRA